MLVFQEKRVFSTDEQNQKLLYELIKLNERNKELERNSTDNDVMVESVENAQKKAQELGIEQWDEQKIQQVLRDSA